MVSIPPATVTFTFSFITCGSSAVMTYSLSFSAMSTTGIHSVAGDSRPSPVPPRRGKLNAPRMRFWNSSSSRTGFQRVSAFVMFLGGGWRGLCRSAWPSAFVSSPTGRRLLWVSDHRDRRRHPIFRPIKNRANFAAAIFPRSARAHAAEMGNVGAPCRHNPCNPDTHPAPRTPLPATRSVLPAPCSALRYQPSAINHPLSTTAAPRSPMRN